MGFFRRSVVACLTTCSGVVTKAAQTLFGECRENSENEYVVRKHVCNIYINPRYLPIMSKVSENVTKITVKTVLISQRFCHISRTANTSCQQVCRHSIRIVKMVKYTVLAIFVSRFYTGITLFLAAYVVTNLQATCAVTSLLA